MIQLSLNLCQIFNLQIRLVRISRLFVSYMLVSCNSVHALPFREGRDSRVIMDSKMNLQRIGIQYNYTYIRAVEIQSVKFLSFLPLECFKRYFKFKNSFN
jgi:hypothetical protein